MVGAACRTALLLRRDGVNQENWDRARAFHGHECPGLAIGVRVCEAAAQVMDIGRAEDEELVCIVENDACGVDAVQALVGCTFGKGNLLYKPRGKQAFTFVRRRDGLAVRFVLKARNDGMERETWRMHLLAAPVDALFDWREATTPAPEAARRFASVQCEQCGEAAAENMIRLQEGKKVCLDCCAHYDRGW